MKKSIVKRIGIILFFAMTAAVLISMLSLTVSAADASNDNTGDGRTFTSTDEFSMTVPLDTQPTSYMAEINVPKVREKRALYLEITANPIFLDLILK